MDSRKNLNNSFGQNNFTVIKLTYQLNEISGIAFSEKGNLFAHNDEIGIVYQIDANSGKIIKSFQLGKWELEADFEDITIANNKFYLITSNGKLYEFIEGNDNDKVDFNEINLSFPSKSEIEGLCYDITTNALLIACKNYFGKIYKNQRPIYTFNLSTNKLNTNPRFLISLIELNNKFGIKDFFPSAIAREPKTGNFFILSSKGNPAIIEIDSVGTIVDANTLSKNAHPQPEGLAFNKNGDLIISDEAKGNYATLTIYKYQNK